MATKMRIVGLNESRRGNEPYAVYVQKYDRKNGWEQESISENEFNEMMKTEYPKYWSEYEASETEKSAMAWFYNYGEDGNETYIFV